MNTEQARTLVKETFPHVFDKGRFREFAINLLNNMDESKAQVWNTTYIKDAFKDHVKGYERLGTYTSPDSEKLDVLIVHLTAESKLQRTRTAIRNFVADHLKTRDGKEAALVAFVSPSEQKSWRFSYIKMEYAAIEKADGKVGVHTKLTPARRSSYIVGEDESCHTAQSRFLDLLQDTENHPTLAQVEDAFSVEAVTKEFFEQYKELFLELAEELEAIAKKDKVISSEFTEKKVSTADFAKKLMGQIVFLYFLQKKGWLGVPKGKDWGDGPHNFLRQLFDGKFGGYKNFFNDILEPLFYDTLATDRGHTAMCEIFKCRIPFLNGGLFEPLAGYDWQKTEIFIPNSLFSNTKTTGTGDTGTGILDVFDRYNFTVNEAEPLEKEVAIDPEMLGKVFENLLGVKERKSKGSFYTPREIVHYMCQESLINYLDTAVNSSAETIGTEKRKQALFGDEKAEQTLITTAVRKELIPRADIETFIHSGDQASYYEAARVDGTSYQRKLPKTIETHARLLDDKLTDIAVCDPAIGSGAFPVGMMQEIVRARSALTPYFNDLKDRTAYHFKRHAIQNCIYGVDIDPGAVEIAKLRLWLSLVVDEDDVKQIKPLPNLDYKIVVGNSLLGVDKNELENWQAFHRLEEIKPKFFDEAHGEKKRQIKDEIDRLIHQLTNGKENFDFEIYFSEVFHRRKGFDVVIGNPPYIPIEAMSENEKRSYEKKFPQLSRKYDSSVVFILAGLGHANPTGVLSYISSVTWQTGENFGEVRKHIVQNGSVRLLINLPFDMFEEAYVDTGVYLLSRQPASNYLLYRFPKMPEQFVMNSLPFEAVSCDLLQPPDFKLVLNPQVAKMLHRIRKKIAHKNLGDISISTQGLAGSSFSLSARPAVGDVFKFVERGQVYRYSLEVASTFNTDMSEKPSLKPFYEAGEKILIRRVINRQDRLMATISEDRLVFKKDVNPFRVTDKKFSTKFVLGILNSCLVSFIYVNTSSIATKDDFRQTTLAELRRIPIPAEASEQQKPVERLVERILSAKQRDAGGDVSALEGELDELVYALYGLTADEIAIVKGPPK
jgi:type I restriction-modification system DNA methylase subunit